VHRDNAVSARFMQQIPVFFNPTWITITAGVRTDRWKWMHRNHERFSHPS
jgi:hypothetical protein